MQSRTNTQNQKMFEQIRDNWGCIVNAKDILFPPTSFQVQMFMEDILYKIEVNIDTMNSIKPWADNQQPQKLLKQNDSNGNDKSHQHLHIEIFLEDILHKVEVAIDSKQAQANEVEVPNYLSQMYQDDTTHQTHTLPVQVQSFLDDLLINVDELLTSRFTLQADPMYSMSSASSNEQTVKKCLPLTIGIPSKHNEEHAEVQMVMDSILENLKHLMDCDAQSDSKFLESSGNSIKCEATELVSVSSTNEFVPDIIKADVYRCQHPQYQEKGNFIKGSDQPITSDVFLSLGKHRLIGTCSEDIDEQGKLPLKKMRLGYSAGELSVFENRIETSKFKLMEDQPSKEDSELTSFIEACVLESLDNHVELLNDEQPPGNDSKQRHCSEARGAEENGDNSEKKLVITENIVDRVEEIDGLENVENNVGITQLMEEECLGDENGNFRLGSTIAEVHVNVKNHVETSKIITKEPLEENRKRIVTRNDPDSYEIVAKKRKNNQQETETVQPQPNDTHGFQSDSGAMASSYSCVPPLQKGDYLLGKKIDLPDNIEQIPDLKETGIATQGFATQNTNREDSDTSVTMNNVEVEDQQVPSLVEVNANEDEKVTDTNFFSSTNGEQKDTEIKGEISVNEDHGTLSPPEMIDNQQEHQLQDAEDDPSSPQMVPTIDSKAAVDESAFEILQTLQYQTQHPTISEHTIMPVFNSGQKTTTLVKRLSSIPQCTRKKRIGLSRKQRVPSLHSFNRSLQPLVPRTNEQ